MLLRTAFFGSGVHALKGLRIGETASKSLVSNANLVIRLRKMPKISWSTVKSAKLETT